MGWELLCFVQLETAEVHSTQQPHLHAWVVQNILKRKFWAASGQKFFKFLFHICTVLVTPQIIREKMSFISKL